MGNKICNVICWGLEKCIQMVCFLPFVESRLSLRSYISHCDCKCHSRKTGIGLHKQSVAKHVKILLVINDTSWCSLNMLRIQNPHSDWRSIPLFLHTIFFTDSFFFGLFPFSEDYPCLFLLTDLDFYFFHLLSKKQLWPFKNLKENQKVQIWFAYHFSLSLDSPYLCHFLALSHIIFGAQNTSSSHTSSTTQRHTLNRKWALKIIFLPCCSRYLYFFSLLNLLSSSSTKHITRSRTYSPCWTKDP